MGLLSKSKEELIEEVKALQNKITQLENGKVKKPINSAYPGMAVVNNYEQTLRESQERLKLALEVANLGVWEWIVSSNKVCWSKKAYEIFELKKSDDKVDFNTFMSFVHPEDKNTLQEVLDKAIKEKKAFELEHRIVCKNKKIKWIFCKGIIITDEAGNVVKMTGNMLDISLRIQIREELKSSEEKYRLCFQKNPMPMWVYNQKTFEFIAVNEAAVEHYGYSEKEFLSKTIMDIRPAEEIMRLLERPDKPVNDNSRELAFQGLWKHRKKDGTIIDVEVSRGYITVNGQEASLAIVNDVTEKVKTNERVLASEKSYRELFDSSTDLQYIHDEKGVFIDVNKATLKKYGYTREEIFGKTPEMFGAPGMNDMNQVFEKIKKAWDGDPQTLEWWSRKKNGEVFPKELTLRRGTYFGKEVIIATGKDISERKEYEKQLLEKEQKLSMVLNNIDYLTYNFSIEKDGKLTIKYISPQVEKIIGFSLDEFSESFNRDKLKECYHPDDLPKLMEAGNIIKNTKKSTTVNYRFKKKTTGEYIWLEESIFPQFDEEGNRVANLGIARDVTGQTIAQQTLKESEERYRLLFESNMAGVFRTNLKGELLECNHSFSSVFGFDSIEEIKKINSRELYFNNTDRENYIKHLKERKQLNNYRLRHKGKKGNEIWVLANVALVYNSKTDQENIVGTLVEITEWKLAEEKIKESEKRFRLLSEAAIEGIVFSQEQVIIDVNDRFIFMHGYNSREEVIGKKITDFLIDHEITENNNKSNGSSGLPVEIKSRKKDNSLITVETRGENIPFHGKNIRISVLYDITERKKYENALKESERALLTLMGNLPGMAYRCRNDRNWTMEFVSNGCLQLTEYSPAALVNNKEVAYAEIIHNEDKENVWNIVQSAMEAKSAFQLEYRIITASGKEKWVWEQGTGVYDERGELLAIEGFIADISERKEYNNKINRSRESYKSLVERLPVGLLLFVEDKIIFANDSLSQMMGMTGGEQLQSITVKQYLKRFVLPEYIDEIRTRVAEVKKDRKADLPFLEIKIKRQDGTVAEVETKAIGFDYFGKPAIQVVFYDISYRKMLQRESLRAEIAEEINKKLQREISERIKAEKKLIETQKLTRSIIDSSLDMIAATDKKGGIIEFNESAQECFGYSFEEVLGKNPSVFYADYNEFEKISEIIRQKGRFTGEVTNKRRNGETFISYLSASVLINESGELVGSMGVSRDISESKLAEKRKEVQYKITKVLSEAKTLSDAAQDIIRIVCESLNLKCGVMWCIDEKSNELHWEQSWGSLDATIKKFENHSRKTTFLKGIGLPGRVWKTGKPAWIKDLAKDKNFPRASFAKKAGLIEGFGFPVESGGVLLGVIEFFDSQVHKTSSEHLAMMETVGSQIGQFVIKKRAQEELKQSEERYKTLFNQALIGIARVALDGRFMEVNQKLCDIVGYSQEELKAMTFAEITYKEDLRKSIENQKKLINKETNVFATEKRYIHKNGSVIFVNLAASLVKDIKGNPEYFVSVFEDISERKKAEEELRLSEEKYRAIYNQAFIGIARVDVVNGAFIEVNQRLCDVFGYTREELCKLNFVDITHPEEIKESIKSKELFLREYPNNFTKERRYIHKNGAVVYTNLTVSMVKDFNGNPEYFIFVYEDITARKRAEEKILAQAAKINAIFENSSFQIWTLNKKFELTSFNKNYSKAVNRFFGVKPVIGVNTMEEVNRLLDKHEVELLLKPYFNVFSGVPQYFEIPVTNKKGNTIWLETYLNPIILENGQIEEISCIAQDISDKKYAEKKLKDSLKEKEVLLKEVHHRVKNNLQVISSILNLQASYVKDKNTLNILRESQNRIKSMAFIHESLYQTKDLSKINFSEYITNLSKNLVHSYEIYGDLIHLKLNIEEVYLNLDLAIPCGLIINELISNSLKYAFPDKRKGEVYIEVKSVKQNIKMSLSDNGVGFPAGVDFKNTETLGLQLVTTLVDQINGKIKLNTGLNKGTEYTLTFNHQ